MVIHPFRNSFQLGIHENHVYDFDTIWLKKNRHTVFPCETQNVVFVLLVNIESPFHQHIPCDIVVVFGYLRLIVFAHFFALNMVENIGLQEATDSQGADVPIAVVSSNFETNSSRHLGLGVGDTGYRTNHALAKRVHPFGQETTFVVEDIYADEFNLRWSLLLDLFTLLSSDIHNAYGTTKIHEALIACLAPCAASLPMSRALGCCRIDRGK